MVNNEKEEGSTKWFIKLEVKISTALYSIAHYQKWKFSRTAVTFLIYDNMFVNSYYTT